MSVATELRTMLTVLVTGVLMTSALASPATAAPQVTDPRTALQLQQAEAEVAYANCLRDASHAAAIDGLALAQAQPRIMAACIRKWEVNAELRMRDHDYTLAAAPPDAPLPTREQWAHQHYLGFRRQTAARYPRLLAQARVWHRCMSENGATADSCLQQARTRYRRCLQHAAVDHQAQSGDLLHPADQAVVDCAVEWAGMSLPARQAGVGPRARYEWRHRTHAHLRHVYRVEPDDPSEPCEATAQADCGR